MTSTPDYKTALVCVCFFKSLIFNVQDLKTHNLSHGFASPVFKVLFIGVMKLLLCQ